MADGYYTSSGSGEKVIIFISHRLDEIRSLCNKVIVYRAGTDVADLKMEEADSDQLVSLMLGREIGDIILRKKISHRKIMYYFP